MTMFGESKPDPMTDPQTHLDTDPVNAPEEPAADAEGATEDDDT